MNYKCDICEKIFKKKCHLVDHLARKYPCKSKKNNRNTNKNKIIISNFVIYYYN